jgi:mannosyltransferase
MKVIFDNIIFSLQKSGGISVYWYEILSRIVNQTEINKLYIEEKPKETNIFRNKLSIDAKNCIRSIFKINSFLNRYRNLDFNIDNNKFIFHSSYYRTLSKSLKKKNNVKEVVTVHDFTYELFSSGPKKWVHSWQKKKAIKAADVIICISENTKRDLLHFYPQFSKKDIRIVYNGVSSDYFKLADLENNTIASSPFLLFVGSRAGYKNFDFTIEAIAQTNDFILKIVGGKLNKKELNLLNKKLLNRWELIESANNLELNTLYNNAFALVYPSSYEGFGIPVVEAMKAGCPFIALKKSSIPEVAGDAGVLMDDLTIDFFNEALSKIKTDREEIIIKGLNQVSNFSWEKCYYETLNIYKELNNKF